MSRPTLPLRLLRIILIVPLAIALPGPLAGQGAPAPAPEPAPAHAPSPDPTATGLMLSHLGKADWLRQAEAMRFLAQYRVAEAAPALRTIRDDQSAAPWIRGRALVALASIEGDVVPGEFGAWVAHADPALRSAAAEVLETDGGKSAPAWITTLLADKVEEVRLAAAAAHARRQRAAAWPVVDPITRQSHLRHPYLTARALSWVGHRDAWSRLATSTTDSSQLAEVLRGIRDCPDPALIPILLESLAGLASGEDLLAGSIITSLQNHELEKILASLGQMIQSGDETRVRTAARVVAHFARSPSLGPPLRAALAKATRPETIEAGLIALGSRAMEPDSSRSFFAAQLLHPSVEIRTLAIRCLAHCEPAGLYELLRPALRASNDPAVTSAALGALRRAPARLAPARQLVAYLQEPLTHPDIKIRDLACDLLAHAGTHADFRPAMEILAPLLQNPDNALRAAAAKALATIAPPGGLAEVVQTQGYLPTWKIIGTFLNDGRNSAFQKVFPPEENIDFDATYPSQYVWVVQGQERRDDDELLERQINWVDAEVDSGDGRLLLSTHLPPPATFAVAYAVADVVVDPAKEREVILDIEGDDAFRLSINGTMIAERSADPSAPAAPPTPGTLPASVVSAPGLKVTLRPGTNRFFIKTANLRTDWWVRVRLTDTEGRPLAFSSP